ncbi:MAG: ATP-dependent helicase [Treponema sp.]
MKEKTTLNEHLENLNEMQKKAVYHSGIPLLIRAGAGSGKTRVITTKIAYLIERLNVSPSSILALTFTNKAAKEMKERATHLCEQAEDAVIKTFHSFGVWFLRQFARDVGLNPYFTIYDVEDSCTLLAHIKLIITQKEKCEYNFAKTIELPSELPLKEQSFEVELTNKEVSYFFEKISRAKDYCLTPTSDDLSKIDSSSVFRKIYTEYQNKLKASQNVDFGDLILLPQQILKENLAIRAKMQHKFSVILVDEYQDTNIAQVELLKLLAGEGQYLCVVGDEDQAIYKFRGAEIKNILNFQEMFKKTDSITLDKNYRSKENILKVANSIIAHNSERFKKDLTATRGKGNEVQVAILENQDMEAAYCASLILEYKDKGYDIGDWAIIYRTNKQSNTFETTFLYHNIPYIVVGSMEFYQREEIKDAIALLSLIFSGSDEVALRRLLLKYIEGIGKTKCEDIINTTNLFLKEQKESIQEQLIFEHDFISSISLIIGNVKKLNKVAKEKLGEFINKLMSLRKLLFSENVKIERDGINEAFQNSLSVFIDHALKLSGIYTYYQEIDKKNKTEKCGNLNELVNSAVHYQLNKIGLNDFLDYIALREELENKDSKRYEKCVKLMSMHNTKGLEFKNVVVTGLEKGLFPRNEYDSSEIEEERRLMYVACTRAMDNLFITSCRYRRNVYSSGYTSPSIFLSEIGEGLVEAYEIRFGNKMKIELASIFSNGTTKYKIGMCVSHKDYGYGRIDDVKEEEGEIAINVHFFESGQSKVFLPEYTKGLAIVPGVTLKETEDEY